ncbi:hypothetical protein M885DRAFT_548606 [Pelagophyceae sp. CCMP2097]|nr:hypothetical protein M885DRAFT_548606 [Pelagophyceae sp. CCMP2097]|mmetsp:Transcript_18414/g.63399  ORF Transcript_18414/g.63399 Transcript_18414/m.63399 type:complete len:156 (+) Transcript_18414:148-615(+)
MQKRDFPPEEAALEAAGGQPSRSWCCCCRRTSTSYRRVAATDEDAVNMLHAEMTRTASLNGLISETEAKSVILELESILGQGSVSWDVKPTASGGATYTLRGVDGDDLQLELDAMLAQAEPYPAVTKPPSIATTGEDAQRAKQQLTPKRAAPKRD